MSKKIENLTPQQIVNELDKYIIGQKDAKRNVAIALRNRWRRMNAVADMVSEIIQIVFQGISLILVKLHILFFRIFLLMISFILDLK